MLERCADSAVFPAEIAGASATTAGELTLECS